MSVNVEPLFTPFSFAGLTLPNRFVMPSMQRGFAPDGVPTAEMAQYYRRRIEGGVSLVLGEGTAVDHPSATDYSDFALLTKAALDGWKRVIEAVKSVDGHIFLQLWHQGGVRQEGKGPHPSASTLSPSGFALPGQPNGRAMTAHDLTAVRDAYAAGAEAAKALGFDGVEIHSAHGYLLDQFLWPGTNKRTDEYGGTLENRARFPCEVVSAVRAAVGADFPISLRFSQWKTRIYDARNVDSPEELGVLLQLFVAAGVSVFHASTRRFWIPEFEGSDLGLAGWTKRLTGMPVIAVGSVGLDADIMSSLGGGEARPTMEDGLEKLMTRFNAGEFDLIAVGRAVLSDPQWVTKIRNGCFDELKPFTAADLEFLD